MPNIFSSNAFLRKSIWSILIFSCVDLCHYTQNLNMHPWFLLCYRLITITFSEDLAIPWKSAINGCNNTVIAQLAVHSIHVKYMEVSSYLLVQWCAPQFTANLGCHLPEPSVTKGVWVDGVSTASSLISNSSGCLGNCSQNLLHSSCAVQLVDCRVQSGTFGWHVC